MAPFNILLIHVGDMDNKGSEVLLRSDITVINEVIKSDFSLSISTVNVENVEKLALPLDNVFPATVDIPYKKADLMAKKTGVDRNTLEYKAFVVASLVYMFIQTILSIFSAVLTKLGLKAFYRSEIFAHMKHCNVVISCSDENFKEAASLLPLNLYWIITWWTLLFQRTFEILIAKFIGKPIIIFPNSVGPFRTWMGRFLARLALNNCGCVIIREPISYEIVNSLEIGSQKILTSDTALLFKTTIKPVLESLSRPAIGVCPGIYGRSLSKEQVRNYIFEHAKALDTAVETYGFNVYLSPHYVSGLEYDDLEICKMILEKMKNKNRARLLVANGVGELKSLLNQMDMIVASKMHPAVIGVSGYVPTLCIAYDHKQIGFFEHLGMAHCTLSITEASCQKIIEKIDYIWTEREKIVALLQTRVPEMQKGIREAVKKSFSLAGSGKNRLF